MFRNMLSVIAALALALATIDAQTPPARRVAITIDDGPVAGEMTDLGDFQRITNGLVGAFQVERVPVTMFINERQLNVRGQRDARAAVVEQWLDAGFELGNHTYSHRSANTAPLDQFLDDIVKGEVITRALLEERGRRLVWLRYPYLHSGTTAETHQAIVDFLDQRNYRVAPVTVDYADYAFAGPYGRERRRGNIEVAENIKQAYLDQVDVGFDYAERSSLELFGREIPQILLIHCNELNAVTLRESIARMRRRGYTFITLDEAMGDPVYQRLDRFAGPGGSWLSRRATVMGKQLSAETSAARPVVPKWITDLRHQLLAQSGAGAKEALGNTPVPIMAADLQWVDLDPAGAPGVKIANLWGQHEKGAFGAFFKLPAGFAAPLHTHTRDMRLVIVSGTYIQGPEGKPELRLGPGSYLMQPGGTYRHATRCDTVSECVFFVESDGAFDLHPAAARNPRAPK